MEKKIQNQIIFFRWVKNNNILTCTCKGSNQKSSCCNKYHFRNCYLLKNRDYLSFTSVFSCLNVHRSWPTVIFVSNILYWFIRYRLCTTVKASISWYKTQFFKQCKTYMYLPGCPASWTSETLCTPSDSQSSPWSAIKTSHVNW